MAMRYFQLHFVEGRESLIDINYFLQSLKKMNPSMNVGEIIGSKSYTSPELFELNSKFNNNLIDVLHQIETDPMQFTI